MRVEKLIKWLEQSKLQGQELGQDTGPIDEIIVSLSNQKSLSHQLLENQGLGVDKPRFEKLLRTVAWYASVCTCTFAYKNWGSDFARTEHHRNFLVFAEEIRKLEVDWGQLSAAQATLLGFSKWEGDLFLLPLHLLEALRIVAPTMVVQAIGDEEGSAPEFCEIKDADNDIRQGVTAYGWNIIEPST